MQSQNPSLILYSIIQYLQMVNESIQKPRDFSPILLDTHGKVICHRMSVPFFKNDPPMTQVGDSRVRRLAEGGLKKTIFHPPDKNACGPVISCLF